MTPKSHRRDEPLTPGPPDQVARTHVNPFATPAPIAEPRGVVGGARRIRGGFLFRVIEFAAPLEVAMVYSGWWFRQKIVIAGEVVWFRISWLQIFRRAEFRLPATIDANESPVEVQIDFSRGLMIRRFRVWFDGEIAYDEIN